MPAVEARNLAPLPADVDHIVAAAVPISGLTAWQGLFDHAGLTTGQTVLIHGAAGGVGSIAVQLAHEVGAVVMGTGRAADRETALGLGAHAFLDLQADKLEDAGQVDVVLARVSAVRSSTARRHSCVPDTCVTIVRVPTVQPKDGHAMFFVVEPDRSPSCRTRPAAQGRTPQADRRCGTSARRSACRVCPGPAHSGKDDHPDHRGGIARSIQPGSLLPFQELLAQWDP